MSKHNTLQGLNVIHPPLPQSDPDLLAAPAFPDLTEQLELWTNLTFENDDNNNQEGRYCPPGVDYDDLDEEDEATVQAHHPAPHDAHVNVVTGTAVPQQSNLAQFNNNNSASNLSLAQYLQGGLQNAQQGQHQSAPQSNADLLSMLASIGVDPFASSHNQNHQQQQQSALPPLPPPTTLAQLLALQNAQASSSLSSSSPASISAADQIPASKRARSRKSSVSTTLTTEDDHSGSSPGASGSGSGSASSPPTTVAAEDKRKRNTAASARFRQKKKEREAALEQKAKELESKVSELERECEGLRRENGWLKGLVIGVTGAAQSQQQQQQHHQGVNSPTTGTVSASVKRPREEGTEVSPL
jgi:hypothetical protein